MQYPDQFILSLDLNEEITPLLDLCMQRHVIMDNKDFSTLIGFVLDIIRSGQNTPGTDSKIDTFISSVLCFVEENHSLPEDDMREFLFETEQLLIQLIHSFVSDLLNKMQTMYNIIEVNPNGTISTAFSIELLTVYVFGTANLILNRIMVNTYGQQVKHY